MIVPVEEAELNFLESHVPRHNSECNEYAPWHTFISGATGINYLF